MPTPTATIFVPYHAFDDLIQRGTRSAQPAAAAVTPGTLYSITDEGSLIERSDGSAWTRYSPGNNPYADLVRADGAVAHWRLDEPSGTTITSQIGTYPGTIYPPGVILNQAGALADGNAAVLFNGGTVPAGRILVSPGAYGNVGTGPFSIELWFKSSNNTQFNYVLDSGGNDTSTAGWAIWHVQLNSYIGISFSTGDGTTPLFLVVFDNVPVFADGQWHHLVVVVTRGATDTCIPYLDGVGYPARPFPAAGWNLSASQALSLGARHGIDGTFGNLDEVALYHTALTPAQIAAHYAHRVATGPPAAHHATHETGGSDVLALDTLGVPTDVTTLNASTTAHGLLPKLSGTADTMLAGTGEWMPVGPSYRDRVLADGAVTYFRLGEMSGTTAVSDVGGHVGTISGDVTLNQPGAITGNPAMRFGGVSGVIDLPAAALAVGTNSFTLECWFKTTVPQSTSAAWIFDSHNGGPGNGYDIEVNDNWLRWKISDSTTVYGYVDLTYPIDGVWHYLVCVCNRATLVLLVYLDGNQINSLTLPAVVATWNLSPAAGRLGSYLANAAANGRYFNGILDEVALYHTALTPAQIADHYARRLVLPPAAHAPTHDPGGTDARIALTAAPSAPANGNWWVECVGTSPSRVCAIKVRDGGVTHTIASLTY